MEATKNVDCLSHVCRSPNLLQKEGADIVNSIENTLKSVNALSELAPAEWPTVKLLKNRLEEVQGISRSRFAGLRQNLGAVQETCDR